MTKEAGPLTAEDLQRLADAPAGQATRELRQHDPLWGREPGKKLRWRITFTETVTMEGSVEVEGETEDEAIDAFDRLDDSKLSAEEYLESHGIEFESAKVIGEVDG